ncbi:MAG TPA: PQQ-binding-like beta-propeller repeat protein, partial [Gemmataceae bacterium]|nr:PQQ-binding-like beta-propeller repeat protein [Gemmataceae bacterium]
DNGHTGYDATVGAATSVTTGWTTSGLDEQVYASPVIYGGIVYVATLNNTVYALNQTDGSLVWSNHLRAPEASPNGACGNVAPEGILGTPVIDPGTSRIYVASLASDDVFRLDGLRLSDGMTQMTTVITTPTSTFDWTIEHQRGALAVANNYVYVPFGGRAGDCGQYHGYLYAVPTNGTAVTHFFQTTGTGIGIWSGGGVVVDNTTGDVYVNTGNGVGNGGPDGCAADGSGNPLYHNDAVERLSPTLAELSYFMPVDWQANWCGNDQDLGSTSPLLISPTLMFTAGKWGTGFLVNPTTLGGVGGQLFPTPQTDTADVCFGNNFDATFGSFAYAAPYVYLECEGRGVVALGVNTAAPSFTVCTSGAGGCPSPNWRSGSGLTFGPPIVAGGAVWVADNGGGLYAYRANNGTQLFHSAGFGINRFVTAAEAGGQVFVPSGTVIRSFVMHFGVNQVSGVPAPPARPVPAGQNAAPAPPSRQPLRQAPPQPPPPR